MRKLLILLSFFLLIPIIALNAAPRDNILAELASLAKASDANFTSFDAQRGEKLFFAKFSTGKPETPSCTSCHSNSPKTTGETRAGKPIDPMAISKTPDRFNDSKKVEKWFRRNCKSVLGRECTPIEKGDFISFMLTQ